MEQALLERQAALQLVFHAPAVYTRPARTECCAAHPMLFGLFSAPSQALKSCPGPHDLVVPIVVFYSVESSFSQKMCLQADNLN